MNGIVVSVGVVAVLVHLSSAQAADPKTTFTVRGQQGMQIRASIEPKECLKKVKTEWKQTKSCTASVEPIDLQMGEPLVLTSTEHSFDLLEGIKQYAKAFGTPEYPINKYSGVCVYLIRKPEKALVKCGPLGGTVEF